MSIDRPPQGGLFRFTGATRQPPKAEERSEARAAIRQFVRVLERMERQSGGNEPPRRPRPPKGTTR
jgi:hypothetical protein